MAAMTPYLHLPGTAREALTFYGEVFAAEVRLHSFADFGRTDGPPDAVAHGELSSAAVSLFASDAVAGESSLHCEGLRFALLGSADATTLRRWFAALAEGGRVLDELQRRPWGAWDGLVVDRFGLEWLIGFEVDDAV